MGVAAPHFGFAARASQRGPGVARKCWRTSRGTMTPWFTRKSILPSSSIGLALPSSPAKKLLQDGLPVSYPAHCDSVVAVIDTASKTGTENDGTAVTFFARNVRGGIPLMILDWDVAQIEGALLETWLPSVFKRLEELSRLCRARRGAAGAWIEDKNSGTILLQQALNLEMLAHAIESKLTAMGKDERAINASGHVHHGKVKFTDHAFNKISVYKQKSRNHLVDQVERFRIGDKEKKREDDLLNTFCYGIALALGNKDGF